jgi:hypothetical protein
MRDKLPGAITRFFPALHNHGMILIGAKKFFLI